MKVAACVLVLLDIGLACESSTCHASFLQTDLQLAKDGTHLQIAPENSSRALKPGMNALPADASQQLLPNASQQMTLPADASQQLLPNASHQMTRAEANGLWTNMRRYLSIWGRNWHGYSKSTRMSMFEILDAASSNEWIAFLFCVGLFTYVQTQTAGKISDKAWKPWASLAFWVGFAALFLLWVEFTSNGVNSSEFIIGYIQELVFSMENVFAFTSVMVTFRTPPLVAHRIFNAVVLLQISFQLVLYVGLAQQMREVAVLPYILGGWLLFLGITSFLEGPHQHDETHQAQEEAPAVWLLRKVWPNQTKRFHGTTFFIVDAQEKVHMTPLMALFLTIILTDFFLEVDVTLTKIESMSNPYIMFSSSALAAFTLPSLYFVMQSLFKRLPLLHYGLCFVLVFFGLQLCCERFFEISGLVGCGIVISVLVACGSVSYMLKPNNDEGKQYRRDLPGVKAKDDEVEESDSSLFLSCLSLWAQLLPFRIDHERSHEDCFGRTSEEEDTPVSMPTSSESGKLRRKMDLGLPETFPARQQTL